MPPCFLNSQSRIWQLSGISALTSAFLDCAC